MNPMSTLSALIVEDSKIQRKYLVDLCMRLGVIAIQEAEDGQSALTILEEHNAEFDVLICDLEMPGIDGIELINLLAHRNYMCGLIIVSSRELALIHAVELMATVEGLNVLGSLQKPVQISELEKLIQSSKLIFSDIKPSSHSPAPQMTESILRQSLIDNRFVLHFQPKVSMANRNIIGVEALVRLQYHGRLIFPNDFIPLCEHYQLIDELSISIVEMVINIQRKWLADGLFIPVNINFSAISFESQEFSQAILELIKKSGIPPQYFVFEVTETGVVKNTATALAMITRLRLMGCGLSIDDYGTGYSSIKQLAQLPFNELKLDQSLINGISNKPHLQIIFESTLSMCKKLNLRLVAEGIESVNDWHYLQKNGCHIGQGYLISPPMAEVQLLDWITNGMHFLKSITADKT